MPRTLRQPTLPTPPPSPLPLPPSALCLDSTRPAPCSLRAHPTRPIAPHPAANYSPRVARPTLSTLDAASGPSHSSRQGLLQLSSVQSATDSIAALENQQPARARHSPLRL